MRFVPSFSALLLLVLGSLLHSQEPTPLKVLFLGDNGHHRPRERFAQLAPVFKDRAIDLQYTERVSDLNAQRLADIDAVVLFANIDRIGRPEEQALLSYVAQGGAFVPLHCATYCFRNSPEIVALMGAQFRRHGSGVFRTEIVEREHPIMKGFAGFDSWDETYVHHLHNDKHRTVLSYRVEDNHREPWTWVRTHGEGRVFYTAWGHDHRTWGNPGFQNLVERGIRWAAKQDVSTVPEFLGGQPFPIPEMTSKRTDVQPFEFTDVGKKIPNYTPDQRWGTQGEPLSKMQLPLPPEESVKHFVLPKGFHIELFVSEPQLGGKPLCMTWDERGRLWVAETYDYPNELQPEGQGRDRIRICEDTDGDWKADKFTVFAEKLSIPTSISFYRGGAIVQDGTRTLYLKDSDGDDVADEQTVLYTGWNQRDTHGGVSNFQYGLDNWIWAMQGYNTSRPIRPGQDDSDLRFGAGFFRFRPDGSEIEFIRSTNNNTWGLGISEEGLIFGSTANRNPSTYMPIPNRYYERVRGWTPSLVLGTIADSHLFRPVTDRVRQVDQHGGYTAGAGHALYTARNYPAEYWNRTAFVTGPTGHLVGTFVLEPNGAGFRSSSPFNLAASDDEWTAPIMAEVGPDGNVWLIDWYNYIVQHNPTPAGFESGPGNAYQTDLRDKKHGRIYRVVYGEIDDAQPFSLANASAEDLLATLTHSNMFWRKQAQRLLVERGKTDVLPLLFELVNNEAVDQVGLNTGAIHALWTLHGLGALDGSNVSANRVAAGALKHASAGVRRNALQVLPPVESSVKQILDAKLIHDTDNQVRLAALLALADLPPTSAAAAALASMAVDPGTQADRWLADATVAAAAANSESFLTAIARAEPQSGETAQRIAIVAEHLGRQAPVDAANGLVIALLDADPAIAATIIGGLAAGWPAGVRPEVDVKFDENLEQLVHRLEPKSRGQLLRLASVWGSQRLAKYSDQIVTELLRELDDDSRPIPGRVDAARRLVEFQPSSDEVVQQVLDRITPQSPPLLSAPLIDSLRESEAPRMGAIMIENLPALTPTLRQTAIRVLMSRRSATPELLNSLDAGAVQLAELTLDQRQALARHPQRDIRQRAQELLERGGALPNADRQKVLEELIPITEESGNVTAGIAVFKKVCAKCHRHSGTGEDVGPDLTGMAVHPKEELLTHIIDPSRSVESNFRTYSVTTADGRVLSGMLASESRTTVELFDAEGKKTSLLRSDIEEFAGSQKSLMPDGVEKEINRTELTDLLEFLTDRGVFAPLNLSEASSIASDKSMFNGSDPGLALDDWSPRTVSGVPFEIIDPKDGTIRNVILLHSPMGSVAAKMPTSVSVPIGRSIRALHLLSGVSGWGFMGGGDDSVSMIVRFHYEGGEQEDHELRNAIHFADYIRRVDVPESAFAFSVSGQQMRYLAVHPKKAESIARVEFVKGPDRTAPVVMAATIEE